MAKKEEKNIKDKTSFMKKFKAELKKVVWPTPKQLFNNTVAVLSIVLITAIIVFVLDIAFESINKYGVNKIKQDINFIYLYIHNIDYLITFVANNNPYYEYIKETITPKMSGMRLHAKGRTTLL